MRERRPASVEDLIVYTLAPMNTAHRRGDPQRVFGELVSGNYFDMLGVRPRSAAAFLSGGRRARRTRYPVVVFSHNFWQRRFAADPSIVGASVTLNGRAFTVIGVAPRRVPRHRAVPEPRLWVPMMMQPARDGGGDRLSARGNRWLRRWCG